MKAFQATIFFAGSTTPLQFPMLSAHSFDARDALNDQYPNATRIEVRPL